MPAGGYYDVHIYEIARQQPTPPGEWVAGGCLGFLESIYVLTYIKSSCCASPFRHTLLQLARSVRRLSTERVYSRAVVTPRYRFSPRGPFWKRQIIICNAGIRNHQQMRASVHNAPLTIVAITIATAITHALPSFLLSSWLVAILPFYVP